MLQDILWPSVLVLIYAIIFGTVLFLARRFTRGFDEPEVETEPGAPAEPVHAPALQGGTTSGASAPAAT